LKQTSISWIRRRFTRWSSYSTSSFLGLNSSNHRSLFASCGHTLRNHSLVLVHWAFGVIAVCRIPGASWCLSSMDWRRRPLEFSMIDIDIAWHSVDTIHDVLTSVLQRARLASHNILRDVLSLWDCLGSNLVFCVCHTCKVGSTTVNVSQILQLSLLIHLIILLKRTEFIELDVVWVTLNELRSRWCVCRRWDSHSWDASDLILVFSLHEVWILLSEIFLR